MVAPSKPKDPELGPFANLAIEIGFVGLLRFVPDQPGLLLKDPELRPVNGCWHLMSSRVIGPQVLIDRLASPEILPSATLRILRGSQRGEYALEHISILVSGQELACDALAIIHTATFLCRKVSPEPQTESDQKERLTE